MEAVLIPLPSWLRRICERSLSYDMWLAAGRRKMAVAKNKRRWHAIRRKSRRLQQHLVEKLHPFDGRQHRRIQPQRCTLTRPFGQHPLVPSPHDRVPCRLSEAGEAAAPRHPPEVCPQKAANEAGLPRGKEATLRRLKRASRVSAGAGRREGAGPMVKALVGVLSPAAAAVLRRTATTRLAADVVEVEGASAPAPPLLAKPSHSRDPGSTRISFFRS